MREPVETVHHGISERATDRGADRAVLALLLGFFVLTLSRSIADPDLWGHVRFGGDLLRSGDLVPVDPYSYLSGAQTWVNHEWLAEVLLWLAWSTLGGPGLVLLKMAVGLAAVGLVLRHLVARGLPPIRAGILIVLAYPALYVGLLPVRPHLFTYLGVVLLLLALHAAERGRTRPLWALPIVFALWVNLHGGFLAGIAILIAWTAAHLIGRLRRGDAPRAGPSNAVLGGVLALSLLATLANPYGIGLWTFLLETATVPRPEISEWNPVALLSLHGASYALLLALTAYALVTASPPPGWSLRIVYLLLAPLPLLATRHLPLFGLGALIVAAEPLRALSLRTERARSRGRPAPRALTGALWVGAAVMLALAIPRLRGVRIEAEQQPFPARAVALLQASGVEGNLAIHFDWGEYALWHVGPGLRVSIDGRRETVYPEAVYRMNLDFLFGVGAWDRILREQATDMALVTPGLPVHNLLTLSPPWRIAYQDAVATLFVRAGSTQERRLRATPVPRVAIDGDDTFFP